MLEMSELKCYAHIAQITHIKQLNILQKEEEKKSEIEQNIAHTHKLHTPHLLHILHTLQTLHTLQRGKKSEHLNRCWHYRVQKRNLPTKMHIRTCGRIFSTRNISLELQQNLPDLLQDLILDVHGCCCPG